MPKLFGQLMNLFINIELAIGLTFIGLYLNDALTVPAFITGCVVSVGVGYLICDIIPAGKVGEMLFKNMSEGLPKRLLTTAITGLIYIFLISFFNMFASAYTAVWIIWPHAFPMLYLVGYIILLVFIPINEKISTAIVGTKK